MSILKELSEHDSKWRQIAFVICRDRQLSDDLVNDAYLKLMNREECTEWYFRKTLRNLFKDYIKGRIIEQKNTRELSESSHEIGEYELSDYECRVINRFYKLPELTQELIKKKADQSFRQLEEDFGIYPMKALREIKEAKDKIIKE